MAIFNLTPTADTFISQILPNNNYGTGLGLLIGQYTTSTDIYRSLVKFSMNSLPILGKINYAYLRVYVYRNDEPSLEKNIKVYRLTSDFNENTVTFNTAPSFSSTIINSTVVINEMNTNISLDITNLVRGWYDESVVNNGIILIGEEEIPSLIGVRSTNFQESTVWPYLEISMEGGITVYPVENVVTQDNIQGSTPILLGGKKGTFGIVNNDENNSAIAYIQLSPDNITWVDNRWSFISEIVFAPGGNLILNTDGYMKYARVAYASQVNGNPANLSIYASVQE